MLLTVVSMTIAAISLLAQLVMQPDYFECLHARRLLEVQSGIWLTG